MSEGPWVVEAKGMSWYVVWKGPGKKRPKRIGPVKMRGTNYHDIAVKEAERRNKMHRI